MAGAVGNAVGRDVAAERQIARAAARLTKRPAAFAAVEIEKRAGLRAVDGGRLAALPAAGAPFDHIRRKSRRWLGARGRAARGGQERAAPPGGRPDDRPSRWSLPITALRETPICAAI
jgi:hypothetical protein